MHEFPKADVLAKQQERKVHYEHEDAILAWYDNLDIGKKRQGITVHQVYRDALNSGFSTGGLMSKGEEMKITDVLRSVLGFRRERVMVMSHRQTRWIDPKVEFNIEELVPIDDDF